MFEFQNICSQESGLELIGDCRIDAKLACFEGHFDGQPLMPAAAQLQMVEAFIQSDKCWRFSILQGRNIKFVQRIFPGETIKLHLLRKKPATIEFELVKLDGSIATKGSLIMAGGAID